MITDKAKSQSFVAQPPNAKYVWLASVTLIAALILGPIGATPGVVVAAQGADPVDPLLGAVGLEVFPHSSITLGGVSDVDPLLGAVLLGPEKVEIGWGTAIAQRIVSDTDPLLGAMGVNVSPGSSVALGDSELDPLLGAVGLEIGPGGSVARSGGTDVDPLLGAVGLKLGTGSSFALGVSDLDPLLGAVGLEISSGSSDALAEGFLCSNWDLSYPFAPV
jgi:hypothetical protein